MTSMIIGPFIIVVTIIIIIVVIKVQIWDFFENDEYFDVNNFYRLVVQYWVKILVVIFTNVFERQMKIGDSCYALVCISVTYAIPLMS